MITVAIEKSGHVVIVVVKGRLDASTSGELEKKLAEAGGAAKKPLVLDFQELEYISSAGLRVLISLCQSKQKAVICSMPELVAEVFDISGLSSMFERYDDRSSAIKALA